MPFIEVLKMYRGRKHPRNVTRNKTCFDIFLFFESLYKTFFESSGALFVVVKISHGNYDGKHSLAIWFCHESSAEIVPRCNNNRCKHGFKKHRTIFKSLAFVSRFGQTYLYFESLGPRDLDLRLGPET